MRKKLGPPGLKLFDWVYVPGAGISYPPRVQTSSYHIYERDSAGDEDLRLGSETEVLYLLICTCLLVLPKTLSICDLGGCLGNLFLLALIDICKFDWVPKTLPIFIQYRGIWLYRSEWSGSCQASSSVEFVVYSCGAIHSSILLYHKYNTSAANTTIKCWKNSRETINFSLFLT